MFCDCRLLKGVIMLTLLGVMEARHIQTRIKRGTEMNPVTNLNIDSSSGTESLTAEQLLQENLETDEVEITLNSIRQQLDTYDSQHSNPIRHHHRILRQNLLNGPTSFNIDTYILAQQAARKKTTPSTQDIISIWRNEG